MEKTLNKHNHNYMKKPNLLLIHPPMDAQCPFHPYYVPLRLAYIASMVEKEGFSTKILDMNTLQICENEIFDFLKFQPNVVGISCFADNYLYACKLLEMVKRFGCLTVISGLHATFTADELLNKNPCMY